MLKSTVAVFLALWAVAVWGGGVIAAPRVASPEEQAKLRAELKRGRHNKPLQITPGVGIGPIRFGMSAADVKKAVGEPFRVSGQAYEYQRLGLAVMLDREEKVAVILAGAWCEHSDRLLDVFKGATPERVKLRSTRRAVVAAYGKPDSAQMIGEKGQEFEVLRYESLRMRFAFRRGRLVHITLRRPTAPTG